MCKCRDTKKITNIGTCVVVTMRDLRDLVGRFGSTHFGEHGRCGKFAVFTREAWSAFLEHHKGDQHGPLRFRGGGGSGCEAGCDDACEDHDGCDASGGEPGDCVWVCRDDEVIIEL